MSPAAAYRWKECQLDQPLLPSSTTREGMPGRRGMPAVQGRQGALSYLKETCHKIDGRQLRGPDCSLCISRQSKQTWQRLDHSGRTHLYSHDRFEPRAQSRVRALMRKLKEQGGSQNGTAHYLHGRSYVIPHHLFRSRRSTPATQLQLDQQHDAKKLHHLHKSVRRN